VVITHHQQRAITTIEMASAPDCSTHVRWLRPENAAGADGG